VVEGRLEAGDSHLGNGKWVDVVTFEAEAGHHLQLTMDSPNIDCHLTLITPGGREIVNDDVESGNYNSRITLLTTERGTHTLRASSFGPEETGPYTLTLGDKTRTLTGSWAQEIIVTEDETEATALLGSELLEHGALRITLSDAPSDIDFDLEVLALAQPGKVWVTAANSRSLGADEEVIVGTHLAAPLLVRVLAPEGQSGRAMLRVEPLAPVVGEATPEGAPQRTRVSLTAARSAHTHVTPLPRGSGFAIGGVRAKGADASLRLRGPGRMRQARDGFILVPTENGEPLEWSIGAVPREGRDPGDLDGEVEIVWAPASEVLIPGDRVWGRIGAVPKIHPLVIPNSGAVEVRLEPASAEARALAMRLVDEETGRSLSRSSVKSSDREAILANLPAGRRHVIMVERTDGGDEPLAYRLTAHTAETTEPTTVSFTQTNFTSLLPETGSSTTWRITALEDGMVSVVVDGHAAPPSQPLGLEIARPDGLIQRLEGTAEAPPELAAQLREGEPLWIRAFDPIGDVPISVNVRVSRLTGEHLATASSDVETWGVFVGIADYDGRMSDLPLCDEDAIRLRDRLAHRGFLDPAHTVLLTNQTATRAGMEEALRLMAERVGPEDRFVFFFSGHGGQTTWSADSNEVDGLDEFICPSNAWNPGADFTDDQLASWFDRIPARLGMVFLDSCNAGGFQSDLGERPGRLALYASEEDLVSVPYVEQKAGGILAHTLLRGFGGEADLNCDGRITAGELSDYTLSRMPEIAISDLDHSARQTQHPESHRTIPYETVLLELSATP
jgi:hypothetical protein